MPHRFISLLLIFVLGLQAAVVVPVSAHAAAEQTVERHCSDAHSNGMNHAGDSGDTVGEKNCPCCPDTGMSPLGCATWCAMAATIIQGTPNFLTNSRDSHTPSSQPLLSSRSDIPPTPPPIT
jgi:hypothetical protein